MRKLYLLISAFYIVNSVYAQHYLELMQEERVNFFEVQREAERYFENRDKGRGSGYKQFKRWEYIHKKEIDDQGFIIQADQVWSEKSQFMQSWQAYKSQLKGGNANKSLTGNWSSLGPLDWNRTSGWNPGVGRIVAIEVDETNQNLIYVGSPTGGLWKTTDGGANWTVLTDDFPVMDIWSIEIDPTNSNIVYMGTAGGGILKTTDGGATWNPTGSISGTIRTILVNPSNNNIVLAAKSSGVYRSTNGGSSWTQVSSVGSEDILFKPGDPNTVYAAGNSFQKSTNAGLNWTTISSGIVSNDRMKIAVTPANSNYVYIVQASGSIFGQVYRSTDSGLNFTIRSQYNGSNNYLGYEPDGSGNSGQAWRDMAIAVSNTNANEVVIAGIIVFRSTDGGANYTPLTNWLLPNPYGYVHADVEVLDYVGSNLYVGSDGGIYISTNQGDDFTDLTAGLGIRQFYRIGCSQSDPNVVSGGSQDNGTSVMRGVSRDWVDWLGADGMETFVDYSNANILYGTSQYGSMYKSTNQGNSRSSISKPSGVGNGNWVTPFEIDPQVPSTIYCGFDEVYKNTAGGSGGWTAISNFNGSNLEEICIAPSNSNYIYVADGSQMQMTSNGGTSWTALSEPWSGFINYISVDPNDPLRVAVAISGSQKVFTSTNGGNTWVNRTSNLPNVGANCVILDEAANNGIYVGMQTGVYYTDDFLGAWIPFFDNLPNVRVEELEIVSLTGKIRAGTYGRGLWESDVYSGNSANLPPVADFSADITNPSIGQTVQLSDLSSGAPISWTWSFPGGTPNSSSAQNPTVSYSTPGDYDIQLIASNANGPDTMLKVDYISVTPYCIPDPTNGTAFDDYIDGVSIGTINNTGTGSSTGPNYTDYTNLSTDLAIGTNQTLVITSGPYSPDEFAAWIDYNNDFDFDDPGEKLGEGQNTGGGTNVSIAFSIPSGQTLGQHRLRVRCAWNAANMDPCTDYTYGETEDYTVNFVQSVTACNVSYTFGTSDGDFIDGVELGTLNNIGTGAQNGPDYNDYTSLNCEVEKGMNYNIGITSGSYFTDDYAVWIDWNKNGSFSDPGEKIGQVTSGIAFENLSIPLNVSVSSDTGSYLMRVRCAWSANNMDPCANYGYGETEDYTLRIIPSSDLCNLPNAPLALNDSVCEEGVMTVGVNGTGNFFNWYLGISDTTYFHQGNSYTTSNLTSTENYYVAISNEDTGYSKTTFFAQDNGANGNLFDIGSAKKIRIDGFSMNLNTTGVQEIQIYYKSGSYEGFELQSGAWTLMGIDTVSGQGINNPTYVDIGGLIIDQEEVYGIIVYSPQGNFRYTNLNNDSIFENEDIFIRCGQGIGGLFVNTFSPRAWNGTVHYTKYAECESSKTIVTAKVNPLPSVQIQAQSDLCETSSAVSLSASPSGGTFSGSGVSGNSFDPAIAGIGTHEIIYDYIDASSCTNSDTIEITVRANPVVSLNVPNSICENSTQITLGSGNPTGGVYSGPGVNSGQFDPSVAGVGIHTISYTYTDNFSCSSTATDDIEILAKPIVQFNSNLQFCEGASTISLTGGSPSGGTYSGNGVSGGNFDPVNAGPGSHQINYSFIDVNGCSDTDNSIFIVNANPVVSHSTISDLCIDGTSITLNGGNPSGGSYSGTGISGNSFDPSVAGIGTHSIIYTYTDANLCTGSTTFDITVNDLPNVSLASFANICENENPIILSGGNPFGGIFNGVGVSGNSFDPSIAGIGTHSISYSYTDVNNCSNTSSNTITVNPAPTVQFNSNQEFCEGASAITLSGGLPGGGTYSGNGVSGNSFDPVSAGIGNHNITYSFTATNGCSNSDASLFTVNANPTVSHSPVADLCLDASSISLTGASPLGGSYSGTGISGNSFNPSIAGAGTHTISYTYTDANFCTSSTNFTITVNDLPNVNLAAQLNLCENDNPIVLAGGSPAGGTFSGVGVNSGQFDPSIAGPGIHAITYSYTDNNSCTNTAGQNIQVNPKPTVVYNFDQEFCEGENSVIIIGGSPGGGTYSGNGVSGGNFDPVTAGIGNHTITYSFSNSFGCTDSDNSIFTVNANPDVSHSAVSDICVDASSISLNGGSPVGGSYSGPGISGNSFNPSIAGSGTHTINYSYTDANSCTGSTTFNINVNDLPSVSLSSFSNICENETPITLSGGLPTGGSYSGSGVNAGEFDPGTAGLGIHNITYSYTDINSCTNTATQSILVNPKPVVQFNTNLEFCEGESALSLSGGFPSGGLYSGPGVSGNSFDPVIAGIGNHMVNYIFNDANSCTDTAVAIIPVHANPSVSHSSVSDVCIDASPLSLTGGSPLGGSYSGNGVSSNTFNPFISGIGTHQISYTYTDNNSCTGTAQFSITVNDLPNVSFSTLSDICENESLLTLSGGIPNGGVYSGPGVSANAFDPSQTGTGTQTLVYTYTDINSCTNTANQNITVLAPPIVNLNIPLDYCDNEPSITLSGGQPSGGTYSGPGINSGIFNPATAGIGVYNIQYVFISGNTCSDTANSSIEVHAAPVVTHSAVSDFCELDPALALSGGNPAGGTYSGSGISSGQFDPGIAGPGTHLITYYFTDINNCSDSVNFIVDVNTNPNVVFNPLSDYCIDAGLQALNTASPAGGTYSGPGVNASNFDPFAAGIGTHTITYSFTNSDGCSGMDSTELEVFALPIVNLSSLDDICENDASITLTNGAPIGGIYFGNGVTNGVFDPGQAGLGVHLLSYVFTDGNGCDDTASTDITVKVVPEADFVYVAQGLVLEFSDSSINASSWSWDFGDGDTADVQNPIHTYLNSGLYNVCLKAINNGCMDESCQQIAVVTSIETGIEANEVKFYPNPFHTELNYEIVSPISQRVLMEIIDMKGNVLDQYEIDLESGKNTGDINLENASAGTYLIKISGDQESQILKVEKGN